MRWKRTSNHQGKLGGDLERLPHAPRWPHKCQLTHWFYHRCGARINGYLAWVSGVSRGKGERWKRKRERAEGEKRLTQMLLLEPSTPTQHDSIPSNQNHFRSLGCQLHVSKSSPNINLTIPSGRAPVLVLLRFRLFSETFNEEFSNKCNGKPAVFEEL